MKAASAPLALAVLAGCAPTPPVPRIVDGRVVEGAAVSPEVYAAAFRAAHAEQEGRLEEAERLWEQVASSGEELAHALTRLGAVRCRAGKDPVPAFTRAVALDPDLAELEEERARCALRRGRVADAAHHAERAVTLDPLRPELSRLLVEALVAAGRPDEAARWRLSAALLLPGVIPACTTPPCPTPRVDANDPASALAAVDRALAAGSLEEARRAAVRARLGPPALALRACLAAPGSVAEAQARFTLEANPLDPEGWIALAHSRLGTGDDAGVREALLGLAGARGEAGPLARRLLAEVLWVRSGVEAARAVLPAGAPPADAREAAHLRDLERRLGLR